VARPTTNKSVTLARTTTAKGHFGFFELGEELLYSKEIIVNADICCLISL